jgi:hypothetical protein
MWTSGAEMLPVLLEELKSASLPENNRGERSMREMKPEKTLASPLPLRSLASCDAYSASAKIPELPSS